jgi:hypothetical protein
MVVRALVLLASAVALWAQPPRIGIIDIYGCREVSRGRVRRALGVKEGDPLPPSKGDVEERIEKIGKVARARLEAVCCDAGKAILFVGIEERSAPHFDFRSPPTGDFTLPREITGAYEEYLTLLETAARLGDAAQDFSQGHPLSVNSQLRAVEEQFLELAGEHFDRLRRVLRESSDERQRATAAYVIVYAPKKKLVATYLQYAMQDPDDSVRNNAMRGLTAISVLAERDPEQEIRIAPTWFIEMLNSIIWTDRNKAAAALVQLTEKRDPKVLDQLRERALPSLAEMARWNSLGHALPAFLLVGRLAGLSEQEIQDAWSSGEREKVIERALKPARQK